MKVRILIKIKSKTISVTINRNPMNALITKASIFRGDFFGWPLSPPVGFAMSPPAGLSCKKNGSIKPTENNRMIKRNEIHNQNSHQRSHLFPPNTYLTMGMSSVITMILIFFRFFIKKTLQVTFVFIYSCFGFLVV